MASSVVLPFVMGTKDVAAAATAVPVEATDRLARSVLLIAHSDNVGKVFYGGSDVASTTHKGLDAGESIRIERSPGARNPNFNSADIYIDAANNDDGVDFVIELEG